MPESGGPPAPERIDHYTIVRRLALGGMAEIFLAVDDKTGRRVALKKILPHLATDPDFLDRFFHEIRIQISLKHPNIVELVDCSPAPANAYIVMEYVDGGELHALRKKTGRFPWEIALFAVDEALNGLAAAHAKGVIHRDIKPQNIMWTKDGAVKIGDFGISHAEHLTRLTITGTVVGTPAHMSPEQARGEPLDARTDLFSMGTVLYELLCGYNPFTADAIAVTLRRVAETEPELPSLLDPTIPPAVDTFLRKLHAKDRAARFRDAATASRALRAVFEAEKVERPAVVFRTFLDDPAAFVAARNARIAGESAATAERLLGDASARPEEALWAAYRTVACLPHDAVARRRSSRPPPSARAAREAARQREDPRARGGAPQGARQPPAPPAAREALPAREGLREPHAVLPQAPGPRAARPVHAGADRVPPLPGPGFRARGARRAVVRPREPPHGSGLAAGARVRTPESRARRRRRRGRRPARRVVGAPGPEAPGGDGLRGPPPWRSRARGRTPGARSRSRRRWSAAPPSRRRAGPRRPGTSTRRPPGQAARPETKAALLRAAADLARRAGDQRRVLKSLDALAAIPSARGESLLRRGEYFESLARGDDALRAYEEARAGDDAEAARTATLRLAQAAEKGPDTLRAQTLYEEILRESPGSPEALPARVGLAGLYRGSGRTRDARRLYEEILHVAPPAGETAKAAETALKELDAPPAAEKGEKSP